MLTWAVLIAAAARLSTIHRAQVIGVVCFATVGELTGSIIWGVYRYRLHNLPLFVPPAHGLVFLTGISIAAAAGRHARGARHRRRDDRRDLGPPRALRPAAPRCRRRPGRAAAPALPLALPQPGGLRERVPRRCRARALRDRDRDLALGEDPSGPRDPRREPAVGRRFGLCLVRRDGAAVAPAIARALTIRARRSRLDPTSLGRDPLPRERRRRAPST